MTAAGNHKTYVKPEAAITVFVLPMMSVVSLETCRAIKKHWNNNHKIYSRRFKSKHNYII